MMFSRMLCPFSSLTARPAPKLMADDVKPGKDRPQHVPLGKSRKIHAKFDAEAAVAELIFSLLTHKVTTL
jgi:hypothetical protein